MSRSARRPASLLTSVALLTATILLGSLEARAAEEAERESPPGQVYVMTLNARQQLAVDLAAFRRIFQLVKAVRSRPSAFDGGSQDATGMPDVIIFNEMRQANIEIFRRLLDQRTKFDYEIVDAENAQAKIVYNSDTMTTSGVPQTILDPCRSGDNGETPKLYLVARFTETATGAPVTVAGVHLKAKYEETGQPQCRERNIQAIKTALAGDVGAVVLGGDFNKRPVEVEAKCDPNEESPSLDWYSMMTAPSDLSRAFTDTVRSYHRERNASMAEEWTFERLTTTTLCTNETDYKRSRLDYLFTAGTVVAEGHADHPGWAEPEPGAASFPKERYSDHRWVWGRFVVAGPPRPSAPTTELSRGGDVDVSWTAIEGATNYAVYRATRWHAYQRLAVVGADQTTYSDTGKHGVRYTYAIAAQSADGAQGRESQGAHAVPDARGPRVEASNPPSDAPSVETYKRIRVWFDDRVDPSSVTPGTISLYLADRKVAGRVRRESGRQISFNPSQPMKKGKHYRVVVRGVRDSLGNLGPRHSFSFTTQAPPPKKRRP